MFDAVQFEKHEGTHTDKELTVLALSTCGFCKRGLDFLNAHDFAYRYVYIDTLPIDMRKKISVEFQEKFNARILYPALIINGTDVLHGFIEADWKRKLDL